MITLNLGDETYPAKYEVCPTCKGKGTSSLHLGVFTSEDMYELGPEFQEDYMNGRYDEPCPECNGRTTVLTIDFDSCNPVQYHRAIQYLQSEASARAMEAMEHRTGA